MQCPDCLGLRHEGACPPDDTEAPKARLHLRPVHKEPHTGWTACCPFCGADPGLATSSIVGDRIWYLVGCTDDECPCNPQVSGYSLAEAWASWNTRAPGMVREQAAELAQEEQAGSGRGFR